tara:strand:- start:874 stop:1194 length:321 start_codon:yes stop_codon:yes gene_type:complete
MHYLENELKDFVGEIRDIVQGHYRNNYPSLTIPEVDYTTGGKYWRIYVQSGSNRSAYGFVRKDDGAILKAASWAAPQTKTKSAVRGYITDDDRTDHCTEYSIRYAQ